MVHDADIVTVERLNGAIGGPVNMEMAVLDRMHGKGSIACDFFCDVQGECRVGVVGEQDKNMFAVIVGYVPGL